jgi:hypothetical protein
MLPAETEAAIDIDDLLDMWPELNQTKKTKSFLSFEI